MAWIQFCLKHYSLYDRRDKEDENGVAAGCFSTFYGFVQDYASHKIKMDAVLISMIIIILVHALFFSSSNTNMLWISLRCAIRYNMHAHFDLIMRCRTFVLFYIITYSYQTHNGASEILHKGTGKQRIVYRFFQRNEHDGGLVQKFASFKTWFNDRTDEKDDYYSILGHNLCKRYTQKSFCTFFMSQTLLHERNLYNYFI